MNGDRIHIIDLTVSCIIGIKPIEREEKQNVVMNITLECDLSAAGRSDAIEDTVDYRALKNRVVEMVEKSDFFLVECLAQRIAEICLEDARVQVAHVRLEKPGALTKARSVGVEITRCRS